MKTLFSRRFTRAVLAAAALLLLFGAGWILIPLATDPYDCRILGGVTIDGVSLGGMTKQDARKTLSAAAEKNLLSQPLVVELPEDTLRLEPEQVKLKLDVSRAVRDLYQIGRKSEPAGNVGLSAYLSYDYTAITQAIQNYAAAWDTQLSQPQYALEGTIPDLTEEGFDPQAPCPVLSITLGTPESSLKAEALLTQIVLLYDRAISAGCSGSYRIVVLSEPDALPEKPDIAALSAQFSMEATDACADLETYTFVPAVYGMTFDEDAAQAAVDAADYGDTVRIPLDYQIPEILSAELPFRDLLGHCETKHTDDENRNTNLRLVCEILDGYILEAGQEFSYNGVIGERTEERGFKPAGAYSGTRLVKDIGGGVCQGSSTLYNCVLLADLEVTERVCHGLLVNYLPIGMDAAVNWATKTDFKFRNNFHFPIRIQAKLEDGYMKMEIRGVDEKDYYIEMRSSRSDEELRIYSNSYKYKYDKNTGDLISKDLEARSSYMYFS